MQHLPHATAHCYYNREASTSLRSPAIHEHCEAQQCSTPTQQRAKPSNIQKLHQI